MESANPCGSSKDRVALRILEDKLSNCSSSSTAIQRVYEGTSGSTGISLGLIARSRGLGTRVWLPDDTATDKVSLLKKVGADVVQVPNVSIVNPKHYVNLARSSAEEDCGAIFADQFETPSNVAVHYDTTGPEIWEQTSGTLDAFIAGAGTGGTLAGVSQCLKEKSSGNVRIALADPPGSSLFHWAKNGVAYTPQQAERSIRRHRYDTIIEGVGLDRVTSNMRHALVDDAFQVSDQEAVHMARWLLQEEGLFIGSSSAMNVAGAVKLARTLPPGSTIVTLLCDHGSRHLARFWNDEYLHSHGLEAYRLLQPHEEPPSSIADPTLAHGSVAFIH